MRKLNGSNVIIGFQPILCSNFAACAQEMERNPIDKNAAILRFKNRRFRKKSKSVINYILVSITWHHLNDYIIYSNFLLIYLCLCHRLRLVIMDL